MKRAQTQRQQGDPLPSYGCGYTHTDTQGKYTSNDKGDTQTYKQEDDLITNIRGIYRQMDRHRRIHRQRDIKVIS
jgi:hypothetical protein